MADKVHANFALRSRDRVHECAVFVLVWRNAVATWRKKKKKKRRKTFFHTVGSIIRRFLSFRTYHFRSFLHVLDVTNSRYTRYRRKCFHSFSRSDETKNFHVEAFKSNVIIFSPSAVYGYSWTNRQETLRDRYIFYKRKIYPRAEAFDRVTTFPSCYYLATMGK